MSWLMSKIYDSTCIPSEKAGLTEWRAEILSSLNGNVLEVGAGTGFNLPHYTQKVSRLVLSDPDKHMIRRLKKKRSQQIDERMEIMTASLNNKLPMDDNTFDSVVSTLVLCSVKDVKFALSEIKRVLRPGGRFAFLEHIAADKKFNRKLHKLQGRVEPLWKLVMDNCHLRRETDNFITQAGFNIEWIKRDFIPKAPPWVTPSIRGIARKPD